MFLRFGTNFEIFKCPLSIRRRHRTPLLIGSEIFDKSVQFSMIDVHLIKVGLIKKNVDD